MVGTGEGGLWEHHGCEHPVGKVGGGNKTCVCENR